MSKPREFWLNERIERIYRDGDASCPDDEIHVIEYSAHQAALDEKERLETLYKDASLEIDRKRELIVGYLGEIEKLKAELSELEEATKIQLRPCGHPRVFGFSTYCSMCTLQSKCEIYEAALYRSLGKFNAQLDTNTWADKARDGASLIRQAILDASKLGESE